MVDSPSRTAATGGLPIDTFIWSLQLGQLFLNLLGQQRHVAVLDDDLLPFAAEHELGELQGQRIQRLAGRFVEVDEQEPAERVLAARDLLVRALEERSGLGLGERNGFDSGGAVPTAAVTDGEAVLGHA